MGRRLYAAAMVACSSIGTMFDFSASQAFKGIDSDAASDWGLVARDLHVAMLEVAHEQRCEDLVRIVESDSEESEPQLVET